MRLEFDVPVPAGVKPGDFLEYVVLSHPTDIPEEPAMFLFARWAPVTHPWWAMKVRIEVEGDPRHATAVYGRWSGEGWATDVRLIAARPAGFADPR